MIFPAILIATILIFTISRSVYGSAPREVSVQSKSLSLETTGRRINPVFPSAIRQWELQILASAIAYQVDPDLIASVILQESGGQADVLSSSGAVGLMQVMPRDGVASTFECINGPCFQSRPSIQDLLDPAFNIDYGTRMLAALISNKGSLRSALYAYGPMDVGFSYADRVLAIYSSHQ
jgi:soluble lytic murein transglycosylase-like protein